MCIFDDPKINRNLFSRLISSFFFQFETNRFEQSILIFNLEKIELICSVNFNERFEDYKMVQLFFHFIILHETLFRLFSVGKKNMKLIYLVYVSFWCSKNIRNVFSHLTLDHHPRFQIFQRIHHVIFSPPQKMKKLSMKQTFNET